MAVSRDLPVDYTFDDVERDSFRAALYSVSLSPYKFYEPFRRQVRAVIDAGRVPSRFVGFCEQSRSRNEPESPVLLVRNAPIDDDIPLLDPDDPLNSKYVLKTTFVAEAFMETFAQLTGVTPVGNLDIAGGDVYCDIHPMRSRWDTDSSKGLLAQAFHKDLGNQPVVPDHIHMLAARSDPQNEIYTSFVRNIDLLRDLTDAEKELLRQPVYYTTPDPTTSYQDGPGFADHQVLLGEAEMRFGENATRGRTEEAEALMKKLSGVTHGHKMRVLFQPGDFISLCNNLALHGREVGTILDETAQQSRWLIKSANLSDVGPYRHHLVPQTDYLMAT